ncbi:hypothetical protein SAMN05444172_2439 [Burkholderia sp. GAS332]|nr:hypothetical protein SAMN05444172_2439 [Burkholderia sp. GAS332]
MDHKLWPLFAHQLDAAWIKYIWLAIHGGDPSIETSGEANDLLIAALVAQLSSTSPSVDPATMIERLKFFGVTVTMKTGAEQHELIPGVELYAEALAAGKPGRSVPEICLTNGYTGEICWPYHYRAGGPTDAESD